MDDIREFLKLLAKNPEAEYSMDDGFRWEEFMLKLAECLYFTECLGRKRSVLEDAFWLKKRLITDKIPAASLILHQYFFLYLGVN